MEEYNKLVRDKIPKKILDNGGQCETRILSKTEMEMALIDKIIEEALELKNATTTNDKNKEFADVLIAALAYGEHRKLSREKIAEILDENLAEKGGFKKRVFLIRATKR